MLAVSEWRTPKARTLFSILDPFPLIYTGFCFDGGGSREQLSGLEGGTFIHCRNHNFRVFSNSKIFKNVKKINEKLTILRKFSKLYTKISMENRFVNSFSLPSSKTFAILYTSGKYQKIFLVGLGGLIMFYIWKNLVTKLFLVESVYCNGRVINENNPFDFQIIICNYSNTKKFLRRFEKFSTLDVPTSHNCSSFCTVSLILIEIRSQHIVIRFLRSLITFA